MASKTALKAQVILAFKKLDTLNTDYLLCISTSECMLGHAFTWSETKTRPKIIKKYYSDYGLQMLT